MKTLKFLAAWIRYKIKRFKRVKEQPILQDLLLDDAHDFCIQCDEIFFKKNKKHRFCSERCRSKFHNSKR